MIYSINGLAQKNGRQTLFQQMIFRHDRDRVRVYRVRNKVSGRVSVMLRSIGLRNSYFPTGISELQVRGVRRIPSFLLGYTTFPTSMERYFLLGNS